ncbi:unnamed protein product, partial [Nesidiocoris tenuis]
SPLLSTPKNGIVGAKKPGTNPPNGNGGGRSNSTLSSKEVEFQNWKRRKNYDPMKAAAQGKKKEVPAKKPAGAAGGAAPSPMAKHGNTPVSGPSTNTRSYVE